MLSTEFGVFFKTIQDELTACHIGFFTVHFVVDNAPAVFETYIMSHWVNHENHWIYEYSFQFKSTESHIAFGHTANHAKTANGISIDLFARDLNAFQRKSSFISEKLK